MDLRPWHRLHVVAWFAVVAFWLLLTVSAAAELEHIEVSVDGRGFVLKPSGRKFTPWGFNYDHDNDGKLLEDYWESDWPAVERHFAQMRELGANVVRIHLQLGRFMQAADEPNDDALDRMTKLIELAQQNALYLDLTGLGCYHKQDVPDWYDDLSESDRWDVQARFWRAVASRAANSPALFCYDLMNEPVVAGGRREDNNWLGPPFAGKHFVQYVSLDPCERTRPEVARQWIQRLVTAIREVDRRHLITVGLVDWSLDRPGLTSGFVPKEIAADLDFLCVHLYPETGKLDEALETLSGFAAVGKPVLIEETFPLQCSPEEFDTFLEKSAEHAAGWVGFYWGRPPEELRRSTTIADALMLQWLEVFRAKVEQFRGHGK